MIYLDLRIVGTNSNSMVVIANSYMQGIDSSLDDDSNLIKPIYYGVLDEVNDFDFAVINDKGLEDVMDDLDYNGVGVSITYYNVVITKVNVIGSCVDCISLFKGV